MGVELRTLVVVDVAAWKQWLAKEATASPGVWLTLAKKGHREPTSLCYAEALDEALCHGWIDGQTKSQDDATYLHRFTPRTKKSMWSARNVGHIARLEQEGRMLPGGLAAVDAAREDGRWERAYQGQSSAEAPADLLAAIAAQPDAQATWDGLNKQNRYALYFRLQALKTPAGRAKRIAASVDELARGKPAHVQTQLKATTKSTRTKITKRTPEPGKRASTRRASKSG